MTKALQTARLCLLPLELADAKAIQGLFPQWEIVRCLANVIGLIGQMKSAENNRGFWLGLP